MSDSALIGPVDAPGLHVMTFNIRRRIPHLNRRSPDLWALRKGAVRRMLASERPTVLGLQEALLDQVHLVAAVLGGEYRWVGHGRRPDRGGEHCAIFYDSSRVELLEWHQLALSDTPHLPGSASWGNRNPRVVVCATFKDRVTAQEFLVVNTHLDHLSRKSRLRSVETIADIVSSSNRPAVVLGDFNTGVDTRPYLALIAGGALRDSWSSAREQVTEEWGTFPHYRAPQRGRKRIDWILVTPTIDVLKAGINVNRYSGAWPSDHAPVQAELRLPDA